MLSLDTGRIVLALLGGDEPGIKKVTSAMQHGSLIACECCHGAGKIPSGRTCAIYPHSCETEALSRLTVEDYCSAVDALTPEGGISNRQRELVAKNLGWKFVSCLTQLPYFNLVDSCVEDLLHRLSLGVCAQLTAATFGYKNKNVSCLQLPDAVAQLVSARVTVLSTQLPTELHTRLRGPLKSWPFYNGTLLSYTRITYAHRCTVRAADAHYAVLPADLRTGAQ